MAVQRFLNANNDQYSAAFLLGFSNNALKLVDFANKTGVPAFTLLLFKRSLDVLAVKSSFCHRVDQETIMAQQVS